MTARGIDGSRAVRGSCPSTSLAASLTARASATPPNPMLDRATTTALSRRGSTSERKNVSTECRSVLRASGTAATRRLPTTPRLRPAAST